jgi:hypothetical protein
VDPDHDFNRDHALAEKFSIRIRLKIFDQSLLTKFSAGSGCKKLTRSGTARTVRAPRYSVGFQPGSAEKFSIKVWLKIKNHDPVEIF